MMRSIKASKPEIYLLSPDYVITDFELRLI